MAKPRSNTVVKAVPALMTSALHIDEELALRIQGDDATRRELLARVRAGEVTELNIDIVAFRARYPNANFMRFKDEDLARFASSFKRQPFLRNHDVHDIGARDGTIIDAGLYNQEFTQTVRLTTQRGIEDYLQGRIDRFSIGWYYDDVICSVCGEQWFGCTHWPGRRYGENQAQLCELIFTNPSGKETSAVNAPAVQGTRVLWAADADAEGGSIALADATAFLCDLKEEYQATLSANPPPAAVESAAPTPQPAPVTALPAPEPAPAQAAPEVSQLEQLEPREGSTATEDINLMEVEEVVDSGAPAATVAAVPANGNPNAVTAGTPVAHPLNQASFAAPVITAPTDSHGAATFTATVTTPAVPQIDVQAQLNAIASAQQTTVEWEQVMRTAAVNGVLTQSGLSPESQAAVRIALGDNYTVARMHQLLEAQRSVEARLADQNVVHSIRPAIGSMGPMVDSLDQYKAALQALIEGKRPPQGVRPLSGLREAYILATGDYDMTGEFKRENVYLANITTSTMADLMAEFLNMRIVLAFQSYPQFWRFLVREENFSTLHEPHWLILGGIGELSDVAEGAAYTEKDWSVQTETSTWTKKGNWLGITLEAIDKDQTQYLQQAPQALAQAAYLSLGKAFTRLFTNANGVGFGPTMRDTKALFHADHANLGNAALSYNAWEATRIAMARQTEQGSGEVLGGLTVPRYIMVPRHLEGTALKILASEHMPGGSLNDINPLAMDGDSTDAKRDAARRMILVNDFLGTANNWYACADPTMYPLVGLGYRFGSTPEIYSLRIAEQTSGMLFSHDVLPIKIRFYFSMGAIDYRGLYRQTVA